MPDANTAWAIAGGLLIAVMGATVTCTLWWFGTKQARDEKRGRERAAQDAILGEPPVLDLAGMVIEDEKPGLVHLTRENSTRVAKVEETLTTLVLAVANQKEIREELTDLKAGHAITVHRVDQQGATIAEHDVAIAALIGTTFERGSAQVLKAEEIKQARAIDEDPEP